jgi:hypothetical protein
MKQSSDYDLGVRFNKTLIGQAGDPAFGWVCTALASFQSELTSLG